MMKKLYLATALVCAIFTLGCSSSASADSPAGVVKAFYKAMNAENYTAAADCILYDGKDIEKDKAMMTEILSTYLGPSLKQLGGVPSRNPLRDDRGQRRSDRRVQHEKRQGPGW